MLRNYSRIVKIGIGVLFSSNALLGQITVNIDKSIQYQKIDGFGTQYAKQVYWDHNPILVDEDHLRRVIDELGISIHRTFIDPKLEMVNDNDDPNNTDLQKYRNNLNTLSTDMCKGEYISHRDQITIAKAYKDRALKNGDTIKFHGSVISPPHWMKYTKCTFGLDPIWNRLISSEEELDKGGTAEIIKDRKDEFAEWLYATTKIWKEEGVDFYGMGIQNEPAFPQPYGSAIYSYKGMAGVVATVGQRFEKEGIETKIIFPEDIGDLARMGQYMRAVDNHPIAKKYGNIFGVHQYNQDGVTPGSLAANTWGSLSAFASRGNRPLWMTETSGFGIGTQGMMKMATQLYSALKFGKVAAWNWLDATNSDKAEEDSTRLFVLQGGKQIFAKKGNAFRQYSKHVRPGSISVEANCESDANILPLAFQDNYRKRLVVVLINADPTTSKTVSLKFANPGSPKKFLGYVTSATQDHQRIDSINATATITLPPNSISTYIGNNSAHVVTSLERENKRDNRLIIYPNPASSSVTISSRQLEANIAELYNPQMKLMSSFDLNLSAEETLIDVQFLANGVYYLKIGDKVQKLVISKN